MARPPLVRELKPQHVPLGAQISEVKRELEMRRNVYGRQVAAGKMRQSEAEMFINRMEAVLRTLEYVREHQTTIIVAVKEALEQAKVIETGGSES